MIDQKLLYFLLALLPYLCGVLLCFMCFCYACCCSDLRDKVLGVLKDKIPMPKFIPSNETLLKYDEKIQQYQPRELIRKQIHKIVTQGEDGAQKVIDESATPIETSANLIAQGPRERRIQRRKKIVRGDS